MARLGVRKNEMHQAVLILVYRANECGCQQGGFRMSLPHKNVTGFDHVTRPHRDTPPDGTRRILTLGLRGRGIG